MKTYRNPTLLRGTALPLLFAVATVSSAQELPEPPASPAPGAAARRQALDFAFRFASAIEADPKDQAKAQEAVVRDYAAAGLMDEAVRRAEEIKGWRRAAVTADLAVMLAGQGRAEEAKRLLAQAEEAGKAAGSWEGQRVTAHVAHAVGAMGDGERSRQIASDIASQDHQYAGRSMASMAAGHAAAGDFGKAMEELAKLDKETDFDATWWRTVGYLGVARQKGITPRQRRQALEAAHRSAAGISGWKRAEALESIAEDLRKAGETGEARRTVKEAEEIILPLPDTMPIKAPLMSNLARAWARLGDKDRARALLEQAEAKAPSTLVVDQPGIYANVASVYLTLDDTPQAMRMYDAALTAAEGLVNARPRALAVVDICRSLGRQGVTLSASMRARLDALLGGLRDPW